MPAVNTVHETRRARLEMLVQQHGGKLAELNEALGLPRNATKLARIRNANARLERGTVYVMGDREARDIEEKLGLERGWMDTPPSYAEMHGEDDPRAKVMALMESLPQDEWATAVRLVGALAQPKEARNGTTG